MGEPRAFFERMCEYVCVVRCRSWDAFPFSRSRSAFHDLRTSIGRLKRHVRVVGADCFFFRLRGYGRVVVYLFVKKFKI